jgi:hypothetical protein
MSHISIIPINQMTKEEQMHIQELDGKLERIQRSTRTAIPFFTPIHNTLRSKSKLYYNWHLKAFANTLHWVFLVAFTLGMATGVGAYYYTQGNPAQAASASRYWVGGTGTWDASDTTNWSASSGGAGGASVPDATDTVIVDANSGTGTITLGAAYSPTIVGINYNRAAITTDLNSNTLTISANDSTTFTFTAGTVNNGTFVIAGGTSNTATFAGGTFGADVTVTAGNITLSAATFNGTTNSFTKTGTVANYCTGGNTFGASSTTTFYLSSSAGWVLAATTGNNYYGDIKVENTGSSSWFFPGDDAVGGSTSTLASGKTIAVGTTNGFSAGKLLFYGFTQTGTTAQTLTLTGSAEIYFYGGTTFNGSLTVTAPNIYLNGATFNGATNSFTKTGTTSNTNTGGNIFGTGTSTTFTHNAASGTWRFAGTSADTYTGNVTFANASTGSIDVAYAGTNDFGGNLTLTPGSGTITVGANGGTAQFSKASDTQTLSSGGVTIPILTHTGAGTLQLASALTSTTLTNSAGTLDLNGQALSLTAAAAVSNSGTIKLFGSETLTNVNNLDTTHGTVTYTGNNNANTLALKNFAYNNLTITDANVTKATFQPTNGADLVVNGNFTLSSGTGTFDNATNDENITVTGDVTMDNTRTDMGDATWTTSGSFDNQHVTTFNKNLSTIVMNGTGKTIKANSSTTPFYSMTINGTTSVGSGSSSVAFSGGGTLTVNSTLTVTSGQWFIGSTCDTVVNIGGVITGSSIFTFESNGGISIQAGTINVATLRFNDNHDNNIAAAQYDSATVSFRSTSGSQRTFKSKTGIYTFTNSVTFGSTSSGTGGYVIDNNTNNPSFDFKKNVTFSNGTGTLTWTKGSGTITASGTIAQSLDFLDKSVEAIRNSNTSGNTVTLTDGVTTTGLTNDTGAKFDLAGQAFGFAAASSPSNDGTIYMDGNETLTNVNNLDIDSGTVEYNGTGAYASLPNSAYHNLTFNGTGSWSLASDLNVAGTFTNTAGTFTPNGKTLTLNGTAQTISGNTTFYNLVKNVMSADTLTFASTSTQTVSNNLNLAGASGQLLSLVSSTPATRWNLIHDASSYTANYLDITDSNHTGGADLVALSSTSTGGNNIGWAFPSYYAITSSSQTSATTTPGAAITATITMKDTNGNTVNTTGDTSFTFAGASTSANSWLPTATDKTNTAIQFGTATTVTLTSGIGTTTITPYKTETSSITATDTNSITTTTPLAVTVAQPTATVSVNRSNTSNGSNTAATSTEYFTSPSITATLTLSNTNGTATSGSSSPTYRLSESAANASSAASQPLTANPLTTAAYTLANTDGYHTLYALLTDTYGNATGTVSSQTIILDVTAPTSPANLTAYSAHDTTSLASPNGASATQKIYGAVLTFTPSADTGSGFKGYAITRDNTLLDADPDNATLTKQTNINITKDTAGQPVTYYIDPTLTSATQTAVYKITAIDNAGNTSSQEVSFSPSGKTIEATFATPTVTKIEDIKTTYSENASQDNDNTMVATINWITDAPATEAIRYGKSCDQLTDSSQKDQTQGQDTAPAYNTNHSVTLSNLTPETNYCAQLTSTDPNQKTVTAEETFTTPATSQTKSLFEVIWDKIENFFSMLWQAIRSLFGFHVAYSDELRMKNEELGMKSEELRMKNEELGMKSGQVLSFDPALAGENYQENYQDNSSRSRSNNNALIHKLYKLYELYKPYELFSATPAYAADTTIKDLHVAPVLDSHDRFIGNALYFPIQTDTVSIKRNNAEIGTSQNNRYLDLTAKEGERYTYTVNILTNEQRVGIKGGTPTITNVQAKLIAVTPDKASVEISWLTTGIPSTGFVKYGTSTNTYTGEAKQDGYNESHKVLINDLSPDSSYYFQVTSISADNQSATGQEISYTVPEAQKAKSVFVIIYEALVKAFGGFVSWLYR